MNQLVASPAIRAALKGHDPTPEQWAAISHPLEPVHLIAGAGSGKTAIMAARITWIIETQGFSPSQILGLTFTNKAAEELEDRVRRAVGRMESQRAEDVTVQTYHAFAAGIVRDRGLLVGVEGEAGLLSEAQQWQLVLTCIDELPAFEAIELRSAAGLVRASLRLASSLADHIVGIPDVEAAADRILSSNEVVDETIRTTAQKRRELCRAVAAYAAAKQRHSRIDFGDQVTKAVEVLEGSEQARTDYRRRYPVVLLDEYQDTNVAQRRLIQALVEPGGALTAVGDTRQAIYAFRGATMYNLIGFPGDFPRLSGDAYQETSLPENFRSGARILDVANAVVEGIEPERRPGAPLRPNSANGVGEVHLGLFEDERREAAWIAERCEQLHDSRTAPDREPVHWRDIAILVRSRSRMDPILEALEAADIPVEVVGLGGLLKTPEVTEIVAWLRCLETKPSANRWLARVLLGPRWRIHYRDLALCARWAAGQDRDFRLKLAGGDEERARELDPGDVGFSLVESLDHIDEIEGLGEEATRRLRAFAIRLDSLRKKITAPLLELVQEVIDRTGIVDALEASPARSAGAARQNVANFLDHVAGFAPVTGSATLRSFLSYLDAAEDAEETLEAIQPAEQDSVKLMTVHAAKGLEFECVFVPSVAASVNAKGEFVYSIFPNERSSNPLTSYTELPYEVREDADHLPKWTGKLKDFSAAVKERVREDERRLFYVALTRAKQRLAVTAAWWYGRDQRAKGPSLFWSELEPLAQEGLVEVVHKAEQPEANPLFDALEAHREWPPRARAGADDPVFPDGWGVAADAVRERRVTLASLTQNMSEPEREQVWALLENHERELEMLAASGAEESESPQDVDIVSATDFVRLQAGEVDRARLRRPMPDRPSAARRLGTEIHRLIEEESRDGASVPWATPLYAEETELDEPSVVEEPDEIRTRREAWRKLGYDESKLAVSPSGELMVELRFALKWGDRIVRGRIDRVYRTDDGGLEIVDIKTGGRFEPGDDDQLAMYAQALKTLDLLPAGKPVRLTYAFLDGGEPVTRTWRA